MGRPVNRKLHPIIDAFIHTDKSFYEICAEHPDTSNPVVEGLHQLARAIVKEIPVGEAVTKAAAVPLKDQDPFLSVLMLVAWAVASTADSRFSEAIAVLHRGQTIIPDDMPVEIQAALMHTEGALVHGMGNKDRCEKLFRDSLDLLPADSPRRQALFINYALLLAQMWREPEVDVQIEALMQRVQAGIRIGPACCASSSIPKPAALRRPWRSCP